MFPPLRTERLASCRTILPAALFFFPKVSKPRAKPAASVAHSLAKAFLGTA